MWIIWEWINQTGFLTRSVFTETIWLKIMIIVQPVTKLEQVLTMKVKIVINVWRLHSRVCVCVFSDFPIQIPLHRFPAAPTATEKQQNDCSYLYCGIIIIIIIRRRCSHTGFRGDMTLYLRKHWKRCKVVNADSCFHPCIPSF